MEIIDWSRRAETIRCLEETMGVSLFDLGLENGFLDNTNKW